MVVDGTLVKAWASHKSFKAKDGSDDDKPNFKGGKRSNETHQSASDPHPRAKKKGSHLDGRTTGTKGYQEGIARRYIVEPVFGWIKGPGRIRQTKLRGTDKVGWEFHLYCLAYNLRRMALA